MSSVPEVPLAGAVGQDSDAPLYCTLSALVSVVLQAVQHCVSVAPLIGAVLPSAHWQTASLTIVAPVSSQTVPETPPKLLMVPPAVTHSSLHAPQEASSRVPVVHSQTMAEANGVATTKKLNIRTSSRPHGARRETFID